MKYDIYPYLVLLFVVIMLGLVGHIEYESQIEQDNASAHEIMLASGGMP